MGAVPFRYDQQPTEWRLVSVATQILRIFLLINLVANIITPAIGIQVTIQVVSYLLIYQASATEDMDQKSWKLENLSGVLSRLNLMLADAAVVINRM
jgi:hypothetical protein